MERPADAIPPRGGRLRALATALRWRGDPRAEPWLADHPWRREGIADHSPRRAGGAMVAGGLMAAAASAMGWRIVGDSDWPQVLLPGAVIGLILALALGLFGWGVLLLLRRARHGVSELRFVRGPFRLGGPLEVVLVRDPGAPPLEGLTATLRCVVERWVDQPGIDDAGEIASRRQVERQVVWSEARPVPFVLGSRLPIRFELPAPGGAAVGTALSRRPPRHWELELEARLPGLDYGAVFLVPVYEEDAHAAEGSPGGPARPAGPG
jgi:hypothetical protein